MDRTRIEYLKPAPQHRRFVRLAETARPAKALLAEIEIAMKDVAGNGYCAAS
ncbi:MAG: hypothetical protein Q8R01_08085 [Ramlibacter sp.]|nr:hypothetical protein [Ramlibacter sp.]